MPRASDSAVAAAGAIVALLLAGPARATPPEPPVPAPPVVPAPPTTAGPPAPAAQPAVAPPAAPSARVRIVTTTPGVVLELREGSLPTDPPPLPRGIYSDDEPHWKAVCTAPCERALQLGGQYRIAGEGVTPSGPFAIHGPSTDLHVDAGSHAMRRGGVYMAVIGFLGAAVGGIFLAVQAVRPSGDGLGPGGYAAIGGLVGGGVIGLTGVGLIAGGGTSVRDEARRELARIAPTTALHATFRF